DTDDKTLTIHRLVQEVLKDSMSKEMRRFWAERTVRAVNRAFPKVEFATWERCQAYLPHAQVCATLIKEWKMEFTEAAQLLHKTGYYLQERAHYIQAETLCGQALVIREKLLKQEQLNIAQSLNDMALL